jgi:aminobenzoyl-glutamate utilization protein B
MKKKLWVGLAIALLSTLPATANAKPLPDADHDEILRLMSQQQAGLADDAAKIWDYAEVGFQETRSSGLLQDRLRKAGFVVKAGVAGMPTAFVASFRNGNGPVIGILAEFDALPGLNQAAVPVRQEIPGKSAGHGCGHNLFGPASVAAAISLSNWMKAHHVAGELRVYGSPAEEGGTGKVYMVRDGLFNDVDAVLHWHPGAYNAVQDFKTMGNVTAKFRFHGVSAHAAAAPDRGRSALDGLEVMNVATEYLREHVPEGTRIHYTITNGGGIPNVVPDFAEAHYNIRQYDPALLRSTWERVIKASQGAAMATETTTDYVITGGMMPLLPNHTLARMMDRVLHTVPVSPWTAQDMAFATTLAKSLPQPGKLDPTVIDALYQGPGTGSTDVGDISWVVPTVGVFAMTWVPGTYPHTWQAVAASGTGIGVKGAIVAAQTLALSGAELFRSPDVIAEAKAELIAARGLGFTYKSVVGNNPPALDYNSKH